MNSSNPLVVKSYITTRALVWSRMSLVVEAQMMQQYHHDCRPLPYRGPQIRFNEEFRFPPSGAVNLYNSVMNEACRLARLFSGPSRLAETCHHGWVVVLRSRLRYSDSSEPR